MSGSGTWQTVLDRHHAALADELSSELARIEASERADAARQIESARRDTAESLNQTFRRMRQAGSESAVLHLLADGAAPWAAKMVVLSLENNQARSVAVRNVHGSEFSFELEAAGAIRSVVESKDPMVALVSKGEISPALAEAFSENDVITGVEPAKAYLFPVMVRQNVVAMLIASGNVVPAPLEVLSEVAGMRLEFLSAPPSFAPLKNPELVQIAPPSVPASATVERRLWEELSQDDQKLHLQAQRVARVRVAELRLYHAEDLRKGVFAGDIYAALRNGIDSARTEFLQSYLSKSPTMVDYLHLEILRSLAHDDDRLLGKDYPGPMV